MKRILAFVVFAAIFAFCFGAVSAFAAETATMQEYENFLVELPKNWTAVKSDNSLIFADAEESEGLQITLVRPFRGMTSKEFADSVSASAGGYDMKDNGDGLYMLKNASGGVEYNNLVGVYGDVAIAITTLGSSAELKALVASVKIKTLYHPKTESFFGAVSALAAETATKLEYENFSVEVPKNWTAEKDADGAVTFSNADGSQVLAVMVKRPFSGMTSKEFADYVYSGSKGYDMKDNGDGSYTFKYTSRGVECHELAGVFDDAVVAILVGGEGAELKAIAASVGIRILYRPKTESLF